VAEARRRGTHKVVLRQGAPEALVYVGVEVSRQDLRAHHARGAGLIVEVKGSSAKV
jgi:hypothetical protein